MKAIKVIDKTPVLVDVPDPKGDGVRVRVVSSSICGSDLHMMATGYFGDNIIGLIRQSDFGPCLNAVMNSRNGSSLARGHLAVSTARRVV